MWPAEAQQRQASRPFDLAPLGFADHVVQLELAVERDVSATGELGI